MNDKPKIIIGLIIFVAVVLSPIWWNIISGAEASPPEVVLSAKAKEAKHCVGKTCHIFLTIYFINTLGITNRPIPPAV